MSLAEGFDIGEATGTSFEAGLPFGLLDQAVAALGGRCLRDPLPGLPSMDLRASAFFATLRWLEQAATRPLLLALDDLQWSDADSLALLGFVAKRIAALPIAIVATLRPWPHEPLQLAGSLVDAGAATIERLRPLSEEGPVGSSPTGWLER